jgi:CRISPR-associated protein Csm5
MNKFLDVVPLVLTPLTPIHVGCGEDFEPTNYVIDDHVLYHFQPDRLALSEEDRRLLIRSVNRRGDEAIREIQRFFHQRRQQCRQVGRLKVGVAAGVAERYQGRVGQVAHREDDRSAVVNLLEIERTAHHPHTGMAYLPGSSLKGAIRTAWLNQLDTGPVMKRDRSQKPSERSGEVEADLLGGTFHSDPFRLVDLADASGLDVDSRICFAVDRRKQPRSDREGRAAQKNLSTCCEVIAGGQFRALRGELRFELAPQSPQPSQRRRIGDFATLARACNSFYLARFATELKTLQSLTARAWVERFEKMIETIKPSLSQGSAMLVRVGRHCGAESITLDRRRWIQIRGGRGQSHWAREASTIWLAAEREDDVSDMQPFGWLLIEPIEASVPTVLQQWCTDETERLRRASTLDERSSPSGRSAGTAEAVALSPHRFRKGDRVTNGEEEATVERDVRSADARMDVKYEDGEIEEVSVAGWRIVQ